MRPLSALIVVCAVLGGLNIYMQRQAARQVVAAVWQPTRAAGRFDVEITLTFDAGPDEYALDLANAPSLVLELAGVQLLARTEAIVAGETVVVTQIEGIAAGANEFYVRATPQNTNLAIANAIRVRILRDGIPISEESLWSAPGAPTEGLIRLIVSSSAIDNE